MDNHTVPKKDIAAPDDRARDNAAYLSRSVNKPGDTVKLQADGRSTAESFLPPVSIDGINTTERDLTLGQRQVEPKALNQEAITAAASQLHGALHRKSLAGLIDSPDAVSVSRTLNGMSAADRARVEQAYQEQYDPNGKPGALRRELERFLPESDFRRAEATLDRRDGKTNDAGAVMAALTDAKSDQAKGEAQLRQIFRTLNSKEQASMRQDFEQKYGQKLDDALGRANLSEKTKEALQIYGGGSDKRSEADVLKLAELAVKNKDRDMLAEALSGNSEAAVAARRKLSADPAFKERLGNTFPDTSKDVSIDGFVVRPSNVDDRIDPRVKDFLKEGNIALNTIVEANTPWLTRNKENITLAVTNASQRERDDFRQGRDLALSGKEPGNEQERNAVDYFKRIKSSFAAAGNTTDQKVWQDAMLHGRETVISQMARTENLGTFGLGKGHSTADLLNAAGNLSEADWRQLRDPIKGAAFRKEIEDSLKSYASAQERERVMSLIDRKGQQSSFAEADKIKPALTEAADTGKPSALGLGTTYDAVATLRAVATMSPTDAARYASDPAYRNQIDKTVTDTMAGSDRELAQRALKQVADTGAPPRFEGKDKLAYDSITGAKPSHILADAEQVLRDPALRERLSKETTSLSPEDRLLKLRITNAVIASVSDSTLPARMAAGSNSPEFVNSVADNFIRTGKLSLPEKLAVGFDKNDIYREMASAAGPERQWTNSRLTEDERKIAANVIAQNGDLKPEDRVRSLVVSGGNAEEVTASVRAMTPQQITDLKNAYATKYGGDLGNDLLSHVKEADRASMKNLLDTQPGDGRQNYYDSYAKLLDGKTGISVAGTEMTAERAATMYQAALESYQRQYEKLNPEQQKQMDQFFNKALEQHKESKQKLAEILVDATITAGALVAAPFTAGASTAAIIGASATAGATFRVGAMAALQGKDFDASAENVVKQLIIGGTTAALGSIGLNVRAGETVAETAAVRAASQAERAAVVDAERATASQAGRNELERTSLNRVVPAEVDRKAEAAAEMLKPYQVEAEARLRQIAGSPMVKDAARTEQQTLEIQQKFLDRLKAMNNPSKEEIAALIQESRTAAGPNASEAVAKFFKDVEKSSQGEGGARTAVNKATSMIDKQTGRVSVLNQLSSYAEAGNPIPINVLSSKWLDETTRELTARYPELNTGVTGLKRQLDVMNSFAARYSGALADSYPLLASKDFVSTEEQLRNLVPLDNKTLDRIAGYRQMMKDGTLPQNVDRTLMDKVLTEREAELRGALRVPKDNPLPAGAGEQLYSKEQKLGQFDSSWGRLSKEEMDKLPEAMRKSLQEFRAGLTGTAYRFDLQRLPDGRFLARSFDRAHDTANTKGYMQMFNADGTPVGNRLHVLWNGGPNGPSKIVDIKVESSRGDEIAAAIADGNIKTPDGPKLRVYNKDNRDRDYLNNPEIQREFDYRQYGFTNSADFLKWLTNTF